MGAELLMVWWLGSCIIDGMQCGVWKYFTCMAFLPGLLSHEAGRTMICWNIMNCLPRDTVSHPGRFESSGITATAHIKAYELLCKCVCVCYMGKYGSRTVCLSLPKKWSIKLSGTLEHWNISQKSASCHKILGLLGTLCKTFWTALIALCLSVCK